MVALVPRDEFDTYAADTKRLYNQQDQYGETNLAWPFTGPQSFSRTRGQTKPETQAAATAAVEEKDFGRGSHG